MNAPLRGPVPPHPTHYERLGLPENATPAEIDAAWQARGATLPPHDPMAPSLVTPGTSETAALRAAAQHLAYAVLRHPDRRAVYDRWLATQRTAPRGPVARRLAAAGAIIRAWLPGTRR